MKRVLLFSLLILGLIGISFIGISEYTVFAPSLVEADLDKAKEVKKIEERKEINEVVIEEVKSKEIDILAVGDLMFHMPQINGARLKTGGFDFTPSFAHVKAHIEGAHIALANLETVIGGNEKGFKGFPRFNSPVESLDALKLAGFDVLVTANNHSLDGGKEGIINTIDEIEKRQLNFVGTSKGERRPYIVIEKEGIRVGILAYTYGLNGLDSLLSREDKNRMINLIDLEAIKGDLDELKKENLDFIISYMHWGNEYNKEVTQIQNDLAYALANLGVDLILGSHPHVIQKSEEITKEDNSTYVVYSMGNFISNQSYTTMGVSATEDGVIFKAKLIKDFKSGITSLKDITYEPTWVYREYINKSYKHYIIPVKEALDGRLGIGFNEKDINRLKKSKFDTLNLLNN